MKEAMYIARKQDRKEGSVERSRKGATKAVSELTANLGRAQGLRCTVDLGPSSPFSLPLQSLPLFDVVQTGWGRRTRPSPSPHPITVQGLVCQPTSTCPCFRFLDLLRSTWC